ncbi:MAG: histidine phosphatase family protein [Deltaproteobacteria bacterium]|jgi:probable phosphoglycerate mutase|nr:histidine phosphatase family protein [Deltaproteobacteria bacterium]
MSWKPWLMSWPEGWGDEAMSQIYLVRHGQAAPAGVLAGRADFPLTDQGRREVANLGTTLKAIKFDLAWVSPLTRAQQTLAIILGQRLTPIRVEPGLLEISLGQWEGLTKEEIKKNWPSHWIWRGKNLPRHPPPGGESLAQLAERVWPVFDRIKQEAMGTTLVVAHQAVNRVILAREWGTPLEMAMNIPQPTAALTILAFPEKDGGEI